MNHAFTPNALVTLPQSMTPREDLRLKKKLIINDSLGFVCSIWAMYLISVLLCVTARDLNAQQNTTSTVNQGTPASPATQDKQGSGTVDPREVRETLQDDSTTGTAPAGTDTDSTAAPIPPPVSDVDPDQDTTSQEVIDTSQFATLKHSAALALSAGIADGVALGATASLYLDDRNLIDLHGAVGSSNFIKEANFYALRLKNLWGDKLYTTIGPGLRYLTIAASSETDHNTTNKTLGTVQDFGIEGAVGSQWIWENKITLSFDFLGVFIPTNRLNVEARRNSGYSDQDVLKEYNRRDYYHFTPRVLRLSFGQVF